jgi:predicted transcriptional regulator of viral defense system
MKKAQQKYEKAKALFRAHSGIVKASTAIREGIHPRTLYEMRDKGIIEMLSRGLYRLADLRPLNNQDLVTVALRIPNGVVCLISALAFHDMTTQVPHEVYIAVDRVSRPPQVDYPPVRVFRFTGEAFKSGIESHKTEGVQLKVYSPEKTLADCFKYRNKIGLDTAIEALKLYRGKKRFKVDDLMQFARVCRIEKIMRPYLEALL